MNMYNTVKNNLFVAIIIRHRIALLAQQTTMRNHIGSHCNGVQLLWVDVINGEEQSDKKGSSQSHSSYNLARVHMASLKIDTCFGGNSVVPN